MDEFSGVRKILVLKLRHIGDVLLSAPVFVALKERFPEAGVFGLVNSGTEDVLSGNPAVDGTVLFDRAIKKMLPHRRYLGELSFLRRVRAEGFDMAVDLTSGDRAALICLTSGARYRLAYDPKGAGFVGKSRLYTHLAARDLKRHTVLENLGLLSAFGIGHGRPEVGFYVPEAAREFVRRVFKESGIKEGERVVHVHPTSRWLFKCWSDKAMAHTIDALTGKGVRVVITSSSEAREMAKAASIVSLLSSRAREKVIDLYGKTDIKGLAAVSEAADLFFGVDSAPMHIAAAVGTPVVALFGPSGAFNWGPWDAGAYDGSAPYPGRNGLQSFGAHTVVQSARSCVPCGKDGCGGSKISNCLMEITPEEVLGILASNGF